MASGHQVAFRFCFTASGRTARAHVDAVLAVWVGVLCVLGAAATVIAVWSAAVAAGRQFAPDEIMLGSAEVLGGLLLFHLLLMSLVLLAPQIRRLANVLVLERPSEPASQPRLFASPRANRIAALVQALLGIWVLIGCVQVGWQAWNEYGGGRVKPELYGIWSVTEFTVDGEPLPPLTTDENRWQHLVFDEPEIVTYQRMDGEPVPAPAEVDAGTITLSTVKRWPCRWCGSTWTPSRFAAAAFTGFRSIRTSRERDQRQPLGHLTGPRPGQLQRPGRRSVGDLQQAGGQQQPGARIGLHHVGWIAAGMPGP